MRRRSRRPKRQLPPGFSSRRTLRAFKNPRTALLLVLVALAVLYVRFQQPSYADGYVLEVVDGDTIIVQWAGKHERVRLIGVDTPELRQHPWGERAREFTASLVEHRVVRLELDVQQRDRYGRLLAYVFVDGTFVNLELIRQGYAVVYTVPPNVKYVDLFVEAQKEARAAQRGIWHPEHGLEELPSEYRRRTRERSKLATPSTPQCPCLYLT